MIIHTLDYQLSTLEWSYRAIRAAIPLRGSRLRKEFMSDQRFDSHISNNIATNTVCRLSYLLLIVSIPATLLLCLLSPKSLCQPSLLSYLKLNKLQYRYLLNSRQSHNISNPPLINSSMDPD